MGSRIEVTLVEREDTEDENSLYKTTRMEGDDLYLPDVLRIMTEALRGFGFVIPPNNGLAVVNLEEND